VVDSAAASAIILHKQATLKGTALESLTYPLLETQTEFLVHGFHFPNYLADLGPSAQSDIYKNPLSTWRCVTPSGKCAISS